MSHVVNFIPSGRGKARCAPDPEYPNGKVMGKVKPGTRQCRVTLPYPAPECGVFRVDCKTCKMVVLVTAAGRPDDPKEVILECGRPVN
jgi:hypothetical protein